MPDRRTSVQNDNILDPQTLNLVLDQQLAPLQFRNFQIVGRRMIDRLGDLILKGLMFPFKFSKMRLDGHVELLQRTFSKHP